MSHRILSSIAIAVTFMPLAVLSAQTATLAANRTSPAKTSVKAWTPPKTPDGQPDLQGTWTNATITPFERTKEFEGKPTITEAEAAELERRAADNKVDRPPKDGDVGDYNRLWIDSGTKTVSTRQSSLVVDPPDGKVPLSPAGEAKRDFNIAHNSDSYIYMSPWDRCITRGLPAGMFPAGYNNAYQIIQTPGYVVIMSEMIHETRIIPLTASQHLPGSIRLWNGNSIGHWEGNTLIVDTTNFNGKGWVTTSAASGRVKGVPESQALHLVERFTRTDPETILYQATIDDPNVYTRPWKVSVPMVKDDKYQIYEYACHEGNEAVGLELRAGRARDKAAEEAAKKQTK
jgi:hypothetical protein